ncbi:SNase-domain-containing protein [Dothidotthia symphoricarpi CBS 119687]|uniref:Probable endonuclease LCL3 n=1 Tax=Dothidotthia symphoricarpi CBS 119687 TaxID=1392245 RepID=A0A6A6ALE4_9PLEO|nr:SNase-domain-containing protein [Dothidotthia symphoricarpi CBS 119687]KAF2132802.1 SNase-domain-containing protein [Dothidotthia symphoricarpi CBS 119687]
MRWPWSSGDDEKKKDRLPAWAEPVKSKHWSTAFLEPRTLIPTIVLTLSTVVAVRMYKTYLRRIPSVNHIKPDYFRRKSLFGKVTSVGDADNFRLYHTPGGRLAGWGWLPWKEIPTKRDQLSKQTLHIRIAGVDAPEMAHWGREAQPYSKEAYEWLTSLIHNQRVRVYLYRRDQYDRVVAQVHIRRWFFRQDVGLEMLKMGLATIYEAKSGVEFGGAEAKYRAAEERAKQQKVGMWSKPSIIQRLSGAASKVTESPREYKNRHTAAEKQKKAG